MKTIFICLLIIVGFFVKAQQSELINNNWILEKLIIDNTEYLFPILPVEDNLPHPQGRIIFYNNYFSTSICNGMGGDISYTENNITTNASGLTFGGCPTGYGSYENLYFGVFFGGLVGNGNYYSNYTYSINISSSGKKLILVNQKGDNAIYNSQNLSINELDKTNFKIYPNPVENILTIENEKLSKSFSITIFDIQGKKIIFKEFYNIKENNIDLSKLVSGMYLLNIKTENENFKTKILKK